MQRSQTKGLTPEEAQAILEVPLTEDRFEIQVTENIGTSGAGMFRDFKYRWQITDKETGIIQKAGYGFTVRDAQASAARNVRKIVSGKRPLHVRTAI